MTALLLVAASGAALQRPMQRPNLRTRSLSMCASPTPEPRVPPVVCAAIGPEPEVEVVAALRARVATLEAERAALEEQLDRTEGLCEVLDDGGGWTSSIRTRASWLLGLLVCQSFSSFILADNQQLLETHPTVIYFMTMLVGAGGNAGNQAAVRIIRGLATGEVDASASERTAQLVSDELRRAVALALILVVAGFVRVIAFHASVADAAAISCSLFIIVATSVALGTLLPLALSAARIDAAHASTTIQVVMDVLGVLITCTIAPIVFAQLASGGAWAPLLGG